MADLSHGERVTNILYRGSLGSAKRAEMRSRVRAFTLSAFRILKHYKIAFGAFSRCRSFATTSHHSTKCRPFDLSSSGMQAHSIVNTNMQHHLFGLNTSNIRNVVPLRWTRQCAKCISCRPFAWWVGSFFPPQHDAAPWHKSVTIPIGSPNCF